MIHACNSNRWTYELLWEIQTTEISELPAMLEKSRIAFSWWANLSVKERVSYIAIFLDIYKQERDKLATTMSQEIGKAITHALWDIDYDIGYIQRHLDNAENILSPEIIHQDATTTHTAYYDPKGVATVISPWNYPTSQFIWEVIPPLLAGNTILYKPATACMRTGKLLVDMITKILPENVLIPIYGQSDVGNELTKLPVDMIIFTGSTKVGEIISENSAPNLIHPHLELGGSAPAILLPGAKIDNAMMQFIDYSRIWHAGQICDGMKRFFVHRSQHDEFIDAMMQYFWKIAIGNPLDTKTRMGSLISVGSMLALTEAVDQSIEMGATRVELWVYDNTPGAYISIQLLTGVSLDMPVMTQEIFWPVIPVMVYDTIEEVIGYANATKYGLGGYIRGYDNEQIDYVCSKLRTGNIAVNNTSYLIPQVPFGWYTSASGNFREHGVVGLRGYCEMKVVSK
jgi:acyl-CoA reductase-like NAD-dependent aldehyde dehydrogenase